MTSLSGQLEGLTIGSQAVRDLVSNNEDELLKALEDHRKTPVQCLTVSTTARDVTAPVSGLKIGEAKALNQAKQLVLRNTGDIKDGDSYLEIQTAIAQNEAWQAIGTFSEDFALNFFSVGGKDK